jgi:hypothetical protein
MNIITNQLILSNVNSACLAVYRSFHRPIQIRSPTVTPFFVEFADFRKFRIYLHFYEPVSSSKNEDFLCEYKIVTVDNLRPFTDNTVTGTYVLWQLNLAKS